MLMTDKVFLSRLPSLGQDERPAPIAILSTSKRAALICCLSGGCLHKRGGLWETDSAIPGEKPISGTTVADLRRDGLLKIIVLGKGKSAELTPRGSWFARTVVARELEVHKASCI